MRYCLEDVLFIVAIKPETEAILRNTDHEILFQRKSMVLFRCFLNRVPFLLLQTGVGQANAAIAATMTMMRYSIKRFYFLGLCGAIQPDLNIGDIVIADKIIQHDSFQSFEDENSLLKPGVPSFEKDIHMEPGFEVDNSRLIPLLRRNKKFNIKEGELLSGSEFICSNRRKRELGSNYQNALAVDMESASIAAVSSFFDVDGNFIKIISDSFEPKGSKILNEFTNHLSYCSNVVFYIFFEIYELIKKGNF
jgi:5'-methylthioadenosine/S-adenosylhomocysteine nucleosidase